MAHIAAIGERIMAGVKGSKMAAKDGKVVLITGASSGIGKALAEMLSERGYRVYGTSRKPIMQGCSDGSMNSSRPCNSAGFLKMLQLDVCSEESVKQAIERILQEEGSIDILVNNAGFGMAGAVEDVTTKEAQSQFETNFFGVHRMCRYVLPFMRRQGYGLIVNVSSVAGYISIPFQSMYCASKYALEALTEALRIEVRPFGVRAVLIEPGDTRTGFTNSRKNAALSGNGSVYRERFLKAINTMARDEMNGPDPKTVARTIMKVIGRKNPPVRVTVGFSYKLLAILKRILPSRLAEIIVSMKYS